MKINKDFDSNFQRLVCISVYRQQQHTTLHLLLSINTRLALCISRINKPLNAEMRKIRGNNGSAAKT